MLYVKDVFAKNVKSIKKKNLILVNIVFALIVIKIFRKNQVKFVQNVLVQNVQLTWNWMEPFYVQDVLAESATLTLSSSKQNYAIFVYAKIAKAMNGQIKIPIYVRVVPAKSARIT